MSGIVTRCICHNRTFAEIKDLMKQHDVTTFEEVLAREWCGGNCGLCRPYVAQMIQSGDTSFPIGGSAHT